MKNGKLTNKFLIQRNPGMALNWTLPYLHATLTKFLTLAVAVFNGFTAVEEDLLSKWR